MAQENRSIGKVSDAFRVEDCYTIEELSAELGVKKQRTRQLLREALDRRLIQNLTKKDGVRVLYPEPMVEGLRRAYESNTIVKYKKSSNRVYSPTKSAELLLEVPVFDANGKAALLRHFGSVENIVEFLKDKLAEVYKPTLSALDQLEAEFAEKRKKLLEGQGSTYRR